MSKLKEHVDEVLTFQQREDFLEAFAECAAISPHRRTKVLENPSRATLDEFLCIAALLGMTEETLWTEMGVASATLSPAVRKRLGLMGSPQYAEELLDSQSSSII